MSKILVSVIIPSYNSSNYIKKTIDSVLCQTYENFEIIIVDDGSLDNSVEIIKKYTLIDKRVFLFDLKSNFGVAYARNFGISKSKGDYFCFLDADDLWGQDKLKIQLSFMQKNDFLFSFTSYNLINSKNIIIKNKIKVPCFVTYKGLLKENSIACSTVMISKSICGSDFFSKNKHEDYIAWLSLLKRNVKGYGLDKVLVSYRKTKNSISSNKFKSSIWVWRIYRNIEKLSFFQSVYNFINYTFRGFIKHYF